MSNVTKPILLDETGQLMATYMAEQTKLLKVMNSSAIHGHWRSLILKFQVSPKLQ